MAPSVLYHCPCLSTSSVPPPPHLASSSYSFHPLHTLYFCEECDAVRCNRCVSVEVSGYYCPNCLFEVPSASVRAEKNRCARNCFMCPNCRNTLSVVPSDPPDQGDGLMSIPVSAVGEPPFFLFCNHCRWDSAEVGVTFEKPTGLAAQLQKFEDSAPDALEFDRLKEHFEPVIRASALSASVHGGPTAASAALARDIPGVGKYNALSRSRAGKDKSANKDEMPEYRARQDVAAVSIIGGGGGEADVDFMRHLEGIAEVASLEQRWESSWATPLRAKDLKPLRIPLHSKRSKRCPACTHILIKPEQKAQSVRYKIKLVAANYLPSMTVRLPHLARPIVQPPRSMSKSTMTPPVVEEPMQAGRTYQFHLALTNPLYDPIQVRLSVQRVHAERQRRPPFAVSLPTTMFSIAPFAEAWEYEDDDDEDFTTMDDDELMGIARGAVTAREKERPAKPKTVGVLEKKGNLTVVGGEVVIGKEARGNVKFNMLVSYTYRSDDTGGSDLGINETPTKSKGPETKTFAFYTVVDLGPIVPREEPMSANQDVNMG